MMWCLGRAVFLDSRPSWVSSYLYTLDTTKCSEIDLIYFNPFAREFLKRTVAPMKLNVSIISIMDALSRRQKSKTNMAN